MADTATTAATLAAGMSGAQAIKKKRLTDERQPLAGMYQVFQVSLRSLSSATRWQATLWPLPTSFSSGALPKHSSVA